MRVWGGMLNHKPWGQGTGFARGYSCDSDGVYLAGKRGSNVGGHNTTKTIGFFIGCAIGAMAIGQTLSFSNRTDEAGLASDHWQDGLGPPIAIMSSGGAAADFNNDGWQDLFILSGAGFPDRLFINDGDGTFTDRADEWGVAMRHYGVGIAVGDYNGDGWIDIFITSAGPKNKDDIASAGMHILYRNNGDGSFTNVAEEMGVSTTATDDYNGWGAAWGDYDLDGDLDLAVAGWKDTAQPANVLFRNDGVDGFVDVTEQVCMDGGGEPFDFADPPVRGFSPRFADMNGDRYPELLWVSDFLTSKYFINNTDGTFTEFTSQAGVGLDGNGMGTSVGDLDNDLDLDWYVSSIFGTPRGDVPGTGNMLYMNEGDHVYTEISEAAGCKDGGWGWGTTIIDFDQNGWLDILETNGWFNQPEWMNEQSYLWLNNGLDANGRPTFDEVALDVGIEHFLAGKGLVNFDSDNDGDQDVVIFASLSETMYFRNELAGPNIHWLRVLLDTNASPAVAPNGYGAVVKATTADSTLMRAITGGSNFISQSELSAHFGFGAQSEIERLVVEWPNGRVTRLTGVAIDQTLTIRYCPADMSSDVRGQGDGVIEPRDFFYFLDQFVARDGVVDMTGSANPDSPDYGHPDGVIDADDFFYFLDQYVEGCP